MISYIVIVRSLCGLSIVFLLLCWNNSVLAETKNDQSKSLLFLSAATTGLSIAFLDGNIQKFSQQNNLGIVKQGHLLKHAFSITIPILAFAGYIGGDEQSQLTSRSLLRGIIGNLIITSGLKEIIGRKRPNAWEGAHEFIPFSGHWSFPSGHTSHSFIVATVLSEIYGEDHGWISPVVYGIAGFVAYSRIDGNKHWLSDIILGAAIGHIIGKWAVKEKDKIITPVVFKNGEVGLKVNLYF